jgi:hypothetical protein
VAGVCILSGLFMIPIKAHEHKEDHEEEKNLFKYALEGFTILFKTPSVFIMLAGVMTLAMVYLPTEMIVLPAYFNSTNNPQGLGLLLSGMAVFLAALCSDDHVWFCAWCSVGPNDAAVEHSNSAQDSAIKTRACVQP